MDIETLCIQVIEIAKQTGAFIQRQKLKHEVQISEKSFNDFVTSVDLESEQRIINRLSDLLPEAGIIAEETNQEMGGKRFNWIIDPLDGTTNYIHDVPCFAVSIALMEEKEILLGVVYEVNLQQCFYACKGGGAFLNGKKIQVSSCGRLQHALIATGFPYHISGHVKRYMDVLGYFVENSSGVRRLGSAATDLAYVACGRFDGFYEYGLQPWDVAAGGLIVTEAGGKLSDFHGNDDWLFKGEIIASTSAIQGDILRVISRKFNPLN